MPKLDLTYYTGEDQYSDGAIEQEELNYVESYPPEDYSEIFRADKRFTVFYDLSSVRRALLEWYPFRADASLLEVGGGMGALTGLFCERCKEVTSVELSRQRAVCMNARCRDRENLEIIVGDFNAIAFSQKYDYIVLVGVLEWQAGYTHSANPFRDFLEKIRSLLKPNGRVLIAIENRTGLKYWCGQGEDHSGPPFGGLNHYYHGGKAQTFDRQELNELLHSAGFTHRKFYYPLPDYKLPRVVYSEAFLPQNDIMPCVEPYYFNPSSVVIEEKSQYSSIIKNGVFEYFANSFLVECLTEEGEACPVDFAAITVERNRRHRIYTTICADGSVRKTPSFQEARGHLVALQEQTERLAQRGLSVLVGKWDGDSLVYPRLTLPLLHTKLLSLIKNGCLDEAIMYIDQFFGYICQSSEPSNENSIYSLIGPCEDIHFGPILRYAYCDMTFENCFVDGSSLLFFDQEWTAENIPAGYVMFHALQQLYRDLTPLEAVVPLEYWKERYSLSSAWAVYEKLGGLLFRDAQDETLCDVLGGLRYLPEHTLEENAHLLVEGKRRLAQAEWNLTAANTTIEEKDRQIAGRDSVIEEKDRQIAGRDSVIEEKDRQIAEASRLLAERNATIEQLEAKISGFFEEKLRRRWQQLKNKFM